MTDLVQRLLGWAVWLSSDRKAPMPPTAFPDDMNEAAAEITRLRSALEAAEMDAGVARQSNANLFRIIADVREASGLGAAPMLDDLAAAIETRLSKATALVEQAFRDGIAYATNVKVDSVDLAWEQSKVKAQLADIRGGLK